MFLTTRIQILQIAKIYVRIDSSIDNDCLGLGPYITLNVEPLPQINLMPDQVAICRGGSVELIADQGFDSYNWSTGETTRIITVEQIDEYTVTVSNINNDGLACSTDKTISVIESDIAIITEIKTVDWSQSNNIISVFVEGLGDYEYSLDGFNYQDSNVFSNLNNGEYTVYVRDKSGCGVVNEDVYLIYYPRYFTPNGDGNNEVWQIVNSAREPLNKLYIYDRYGKLITQLRPNDFGWDGTYNGNKLPTSDYWFVLERQNGKTYTGHFTLKR
jgi:gliding motility-associated-like protein